MRALELRCSELPLAFKCAGSVRPEGLEVNESGVESELGKAGHVGLGELAETGVVPWGETGELARRFGVDERELRALLALGATIWAEVGKAFPNASAEHELTYHDPGGAFVLTGHADVLSWIDRVVRIADWKTGRRDADHKAQLQGYCVLGMHAGRSFGVNRAEAFILWVRDVQREHYLMSERDGRRWLERVHDEIVNWDGRYHVGPHCERCPRLHECPAGRALVRRDVDALLTEGETVSATDDALAALGDEGIVALLTRADLAAHVGARVRTAIRGYVQRRGDVVGAERRLTIQREERAAGT